jgi:hypothetical protein
MRYRLREGAGWVLVVVGLWIFYEAYGLWADRLPLGAAGMTVAGIFVFRGGIHLLKVAVAARVCEQANARLYPAPPPEKRPAPARRPGAVSPSAGRVPSR